MRSSVGMMKFPIYGKIKNDPNHQPVKYLLVSHIKWMVNNGDIWRYSGYGCHYDGYGGFLSHGGSQLDGL